MQLSIHLSTEKGNENGLILAMEWTVTPIDAVDHVD